MNQSKCPVPREQQPTNEFIELSKSKIGILWDPPVMEEAVENLNALLAQRQRWAEGGLQRFFDYGDQLFTNKIDYFQKFDLIPIKFIGNTHEKKKINSQIKKLGLSIQYGGRVSNLGDKVNKSKAINVFLKMVKSKIKNPIKTIGVGDNHNDINMLKNTDIPCLVFNKYFKTTNLNIKKLITSSKPSPQGWADVIKKAVLKLK